MSLHPGFTRGHMGVTHLVIVPDRSSVSLAYQGRSARAICGRLVKPKSRLIGPADEQDACKGCLKGKLRAVLLHHIRTEHRRQPAQTMPTDELSKWHAHEHFRYAPRSHYHEGVNRGVGERPPGWRTGEGFVGRDR